MRTLGNLKHERIALETQNTALRTSCKELEAKNKCLAATNKASVEDHHARYIGVALPHLLVSGPTMRFAGVFTFRPDGACRHYKQHINRQRLPRPGSSRRVRSANTIFFFLELFSELRNLIYEFTLVLSHPLGLWPINGTAFAHSENANKAPIPTRDAVICAAPSKAKPPPSPRP
jgi:hypothetical protein